MSGWRACWCGALLGALSCSSAADRGAPSSKQAQLAPGLAAQVGADGITLDTVTRIARAQRLSPVAARERATSDALFAAGARAAFEGTGVVPVLERAAFARRLLEHFQSEAEARGPATDAELAELTAAHWQDLDRPETVRTSHAVAIVKKPTEDAAARAVAQRIFEAVHAVTDADEFMRLANAVPHAGVELRVERLPAVTQDGRVYDPDSPEGAGAGFDKDFAAAAFALAAGKVSEPKKSAFGYHVILCEARLPELRVPVAERRQRLQGELTKSRAERSKRELLERLSAAQPIAIVRSVDDLTARVRVAE